METRVETTATATITTTATYVETLHTGTYETINTDGAPVKRYHIGATYTYGTHTYTIVGVRKYVGDDHSYWLVRFGTDTSTHELTADKIKDKVGDDRKQPRNGSANDTPNSNPSKSKRSAVETAAAVMDKYNDVISKVRDRVSKLVATDSITAALNALIDAIEAAKEQRIEAINNAALAAHLQRVERLQAIAVELPDLQGQAIAAMQDCDFTRAAELGQRAAALQAEQLLLSQQEAAYNTALAPVDQEQADNTTAVE